MSSHYHHCVKCCVCLPGICSNCLGSHRLSFATLRKKKKKKPNLISKKKKKKHIFNSLTRTKISEEISSKLQNGGEYLKQFPNIKQLQFMGRRFTKILGTHSRDECFTRSWGTGEHLGIKDIIWIVTFFKSVTSLILIRRIKDVTDYSRHCQYTFGNVWQQWTANSGLPLSVYTGFLVTCLRKACHTIIFRICSAAKKYNIYIFKDILLFFFH